MLNWMIRAVPGLPPVARHLGDITRHMDERIAVNFRTLGVVTTRIMQDAIKPVNYKGTLMRSVSSEIDVGKRTLTVGPTAPEKGFVFTGTRPHWAPIAALKEWAAWKLGDERLAYAVRWSIKRRGTNVGFAQKGFPGTWQSGHGYGLDFIDQVRKSGRFQTALKNTSKRLGEELVAVGMGKDPFDLGAGTPP